MGDAEAGSGAATNDAPADASAAAGDATETKDEKKSLLSRLNPFGGAKEDPKDAEKRKALAEQKKKDEEAARKKLEENERKKAEREEVEETQRMAAKRERYQQLLQKNPDPTRRVFQFYMKAMKIEHMASEATTGLFLRVTLGGDFTEREEPGKGMVRKGKRGQQFKTSHAAKLQQGDSHYFRNEFGAGVPVYWMGSYIGLEIEEFHLDVMQAFSLKKTRKRASRSISLRQLAQGSVMLEFALRDEKATGDKALAPYVKVSFVCYFQELFVYQLRFVSWRGYSLRAADAPKRKERAKLQVDKEEKRRQSDQAKVEARNRKLKEAKERRERRRQERLEAQRLAVMGASAAGNSGVRKDGTGRTAAPASDTGIGGTGSEMMPTNADGTATADNDRVGLLDPAAKPKGVNLRFWRRKQAGNGTDDAEGGNKTMGSSKKERSKKKLTFEERVELQKQKDEAEKKKREEAELKRLRKLKERQEQRERTRRNKAEAQRKKAEWDPDLYEEPSSDPYIVFSIDPPRNPGCKVLRNGGYFGRMVRTDMVTNTLNPTFEEARKPLAYLGTRSELENEMLRIRVFDWDFFSADDLIGQADVPLNGLLEYGQVEVELTLDLPDTTQKKLRGKYPIKTEPAGRLAGKILFEGRTPEYNQIGGALVERKAGVTYLAVRLNSASKLAAADPNGTSDPFVTIDWDGAQQTTRVIPRTLEPAWRQTLYFPLKMVTINKQALAQKPPVCIRVFDEDEAGHDLLGSCDIPLHRITSAEHAKIDDDLGADGRPHKGRVLRLPSQPLTLPGNKIESTINVELYFAPDLPIDISLDEEAEKRTQSLSEEYLARLKTFYPSLPRHIRMQLEENTKIELARGMDMKLGWDHHKRHVAAEDQDGTDHFLSEYLSPQQPPADMSDVMQVVRMVRCVSWATDSETFGGKRQSQQRRDVWQTPPFFMEMRKGDFEDHALLLCNLLLGMELDAYVCVGRLHNFSEGEKRHVWVLTREPEGDVRMWETSTGNYSTLLERWQGRALSAAEKAEFDATNRALAKQRSDSAADGGKKRRGMSGRLKNGRGDAQGDTSIDDALVESDAAQAEVEPAMGMAESNALLDQNGGRDAFLLSSAEEMLDVMGGDDTLTRDELEESFTEVLWLAGPADAGGLAGGARGTASQDDDVLAQLKSQDEGADATEDEERATEELSHLTPPSTPLLYSHVEAVFNSKNLWISRRGLDPARIKFDFEDSVMWSAFVEKRMESQGMPTPFYTPKRLASKVAPDRLRSMEAQILGELQVQVKLIRSSGLTTIINKSAELVAALQRGLDLQEKSRVGDVQAKADLLTWQREVKSRLPAGSTFRARAFHFAYTDAKKIRKHLLEKVKYAEEPGDGTEFTIAVRAFAFYGGICSVWVYFGILDTCLTS